MIPVNKPYMPSKQKYQKYIDDVYDRVWLTNNGPLVNELKERLEEYLGVKNLLLVANGTLALQIAYKALDVTGSAVTTPFTFAATASSLNFQGIRPKFSDIDPYSLNLRPDHAVKAIDEDVSAIVPVHVYGNPCDVTGMESLAENSKVKLIYDAAHCFGVNYNGTSLLNFGDASTLSFHATKLFHSIEGGAVVFRDADAYERAVKMINFGIDVSDGSIVECGINAKMSEVHAAMGLSMLDSMDEVIQRRVYLHSQYQEKLSDIVGFPAWRAGANQTGAYMPVIFKNDEACAAAFQALRENQITARRYFSPLLSDVSVYGHRGIELPVSSRISKRVLCLPLFYDLEEGQLNKVCEVLKEVCL